MLKYDLITLTCDVVNHILEADKLEMLFSNIYKDIKEKIIIARGKMLKHIDTTMTEVYWYVGKITY